MLSVKTRTTIESENIKEEESREESGRSFPAVTPGDPVSQKQLTRAGLPAARQVRAANPGKLHQNSTFDFKRSHFLSTDCLKNYFFSYTNPT